MRILFLTQVLPYPLDAGPKVRAYYVLRYLSQRHEITLISFSRPTDSEEAVLHLTEFCTHVHTVPMHRSRRRDLQHLAGSVVTHQPFLITRDRVPAMSDKLFAVVERDGPFDAIHSDQLWMAQYALKVRGNVGNGRPPLTVLDQHNAVYLIPQRLADIEPNPLKRMLLQLESRKLAQYETNICRRFDRVVWVTQEDYEVVQFQPDIGCVHEVTRTAVIPICTDPATASAVNRTTNPRRVTFLGGLHYPPNAQGILWFATNVFPSIVEQVPDALLTVIGKQPPEGLMHLGIDCRNLDVAGYVTDIRPYLEETTAFIVPLHAGGGMRVKILDAWTWGVPVVSTTVGAEGIKACSSRDILIADDPQDFAKAVVNLFRDPGLSQRIALAGRKAVIEQYDWRTRYASWDAIYHSDTALPAKLSIT